MRNLVVEMSKIANKGLLILEEDPWDENEVSSRR